MLKGTAKLRNKERIHCFDQLTFVKTPKFCFKSLKLIYILPLVNLWFSKVQKYSEFIDKWNIFGKN